MAGRHNSTSFQRTSLGATRAKAIAAVLITAITFALVLVVTPTIISRPVVHADANEGASNDQKAISAGDGTTCVLTTVGNVRCWGNNESRQVNDTGTASFRNPTASDSSTNGQEIISVAQDFTCAISSTGVLKCWGSRVDGRLGNGGVGGFAGATGQAQTVTGTYSAVGVGANHACAVTTDGGVKCWGYPGTINEFEGNRLGDKTTRVEGEFASAPVQVKDLTSGYSAVTSGSAHSCALSTSGTIKCWGSNGNGQLGDGTTTKSDVPVSVGGITNATAVSAGQYHTCALLTGGSVKCWGWNALGQLGDGTTTQSTSPVTAIASGASAVTAGNDHTCALVGSAVKCWGRNSSGQIGDGTTTRRESPVTAVASGASAVTAGSNHTCALVGTTVNCWGANDYGQLGDNTTTQRTSPVAVVAAGGDSLPTFGSPATTTTTTTTTTNSGTTVPQTAEEAAASRARFIDECQQTNNNHPDCPGRTTSTTVTVAPPPVSTTPSTTTIAPRITTTTAPTQPRISIPGVVTPTNLTVLTPVPEADPIVIANDLVRQITAGGQSQVANKVRSALTAVAPSVNEAIADATEKLAKVLEDKSSTQLEIIKAKAAVADAASQTILTALKATGGNVQSLALPVTKNQSLPEVEPGKALIITPIGTNPARVEVVDNSTIVLTSQRENLSLAMSAIGSDGEPADVNARGAVQAAPGQSLAVTGSGFKPKSKVAVWMFSNPRNFGFVTTDVNGSFAAEVPMPDNIVPGDHTAQVNGQRANGETRSLNLGVEVALEETPSTRGKSPSIATGSITSRVQFRAQSDVLTKTTQKQLIRIALQLQTMSGITVKCVGYTQEGIVSDRYELAQRRADAVCQRLRKLGVKAKFEAVGLGRAKTTTPAARYVAINVRYTAPISKN